MYTMDRSSQGLKIIIRNSDGTSSDITMYSDDGRMPSTIEIGGAVKTSDVTISETEVAEDEPLLEKNDGKDPENGAPSKNPRWVGIYSSVQESLTALCALVTTIIMIMTLVKFYSTSHITSAWPTNPKLYPTYLLLITSLITLIIDVFSLGERYCGASAAKNVDTMISKMRYALLVFQAVGSATGAGVFKGTQAAGSGQDLYGWTCSDAADQMASVNSSGQICSSSNSSAILSLLQTALHVLGIIITVVTMMAPKSSGSGDAKDKSDEEAGTKTEKKSKRASCESCGKPTSSSKLGEVKPPKGFEKPEDSLKINDTAPKPDEPNVDAEAVKSVVKQSRALYTRLQPSNDAHDFTHYDETDMNPAKQRGYDDARGVQTRYDSTDATSEQVVYDDFYMRNFQ